MARKNIFEGESLQAIFARLMYSHLKNNGTTSHTEIMKSFRSVNPDYEVTKVSYEKAYGELKKAFMRLREVFDDKLPGTLIILGNNRNMEYKYIGEDKDPLADMYNASVIKDLKDYWQFCQDSAGFFPISWLNYFFKGTQDLLDIKDSKSKGHQYIYASLDRELKNIDRLPEFYEYIKANKVLRFEYSSDYNTTHTITFHPHLLHEYNGRWHVYGYSEDLEPSMGYAVAIDRIGDKVEVVKDVPFYGYPAGYYEERFKYLVGSTICNHDKVVIRAYGTYFWGLFKSKPLPNYRIVKDFGHYEEGDYGDFEVDVTLNPEFYGRILLFSPGIEIISPKYIREEMSKRVTEVYSLYKK